MRYKLTIILLLSVCQLMGQETALVAKYDESGVQLKWFSERLVYTGGVDVYRKEGKGDWQKINDARILQETGNFDANKQEGIEMVLEAVSKRKKFEGLVYLNALVQCFQSNVLCQHLGIYFIDKSAERKKKYAYKVVTSEDKQIGKIVEVNTGVVSTVPSPINFGFLQTRKEIDFYWSANTTDFFGVHLYAKINGASAVSITDLPIMATSVRNDSTAQKQYELVLEENTTYEIYAKSVGFFGDVSAPSETIQIKINDYTPPKAPSGLMQKGLVKKDSVSIEWKKYADKSALGLKLYRSLYHDSAYVVLTPMVLPIDQFGFNDVVPAPGDYYYYVSAVDAAGNESKSIKTVIHVEDMEGPAVIENFKATADTAKANLSWSASSALDLRGYFIYRSLVGKDDFVVLNRKPLRDTIYTDNLPKRTKSTFRYYVVAQDSALNYGGRSSIEEATMPDVIGPGRPLIKNTVAVSGGVRIDWMPNADLDICKYVLFRKKKGDTSYRILGVLSAKFNSYIDTTVAPASVYHYKLKAQDQDGNASVFSNLFTVQTEFPKMQEKLGITVKVKKKRKLKIAKLSWRPDPSVTGYVVYAMEEGQWKQLSGMNTDGAFVLKSQKDQNKLIVKGYTNGPIVYASENVEIDW